MLKQALRLLFLCFVVLFLLPGCGRVKFTDSNNSPNDCPGYRDVSEFFKYTNSDFESICSDFFVIQFQKPWVQKPGLNVLGSKNIKDSSVLKANNFSVLESYSFENIESGDLFRISVIDVVKPFVRDKDFSQDDYYKFAQEIIAELAQKGAVFDGFSFNLAFDPRLEGRFDNKFFLMRFDECIEHYLIFIELVYSEPNYDCFDFIRNVEILRR